MDAQRQLVEELRAHALILGEVVLTSGATAQYYVDAKRAILLPAGFAALGQLVCLPAAVGAVRSGAADRPDDLGAGRLLDEAGFTVVGVTGVVLALAGLSAIGVRRRIIAAG